MNHHTLFAFSLGLNVSLHLETNFIGLGIAFVTETIHSLSLGIVNETSRFIVSVLVFDVKTLILEVLVSVSKLEPWSC
jgi:hypothetical protein